MKKAVGRQVLLSSSEDVGRALFEDLRLPIPRGVQLRRKPNGRLCYKSPQARLKMPDAACSRSNWMFVFLQVVPAQKQADVRFHLTVLGSM